MTVMTVTVTLKHHKNHVSSHFRRDDQIDDQPLDDLADLPASACPDPLVSRYASTAEHGPGSGSLVARSPIRGFRGSRATREKGTAPVLFGRFADPPPGGRAGVEVTASPPSYSAGRFTGHGQR
jgi:hypothetical protein